MTIPLLHTKAVSAFLWLLMVLMWWLVKPLWFCCISVSETAKSSKWSNEVLGGLCCLLVNIDRFLSGWGVGFINVMMEKSSSCISVDVDGEGELMPCWCSSCLAQNLLLCLFSFSLVVTDVFDAFWHFFPPLLALTLAFLIRSIKTSFSESLLLSYGSMWWELSPFSTGFFPLQARFLQDKIISL